MDFDACAKSIHERLTNEYDWKNIPFNHSGTYWRESLFELTKSPDKTYIETNLHKSLRFNIIGLSYDECIELVENVEQFYNSILFNGSRTQKIKYLNTEKNWRKLGMRKREKRFFRVSIFVIILF
jgi:hypothetical protein